MYPVCRASNCFCCYLVCIVVWLLDLLDLFVRFMHIYLIREIQRSYLLAYDLSGSSRGREEVMGCLESMLFACVAECNDADG